MVSKRTLEILSVISYPTNIVIPLIIAFSWKIPDILVAVLFISVIPFLLTAFYAKEEKVNVDIFEQKKRSIPFVVGMALFAIGAVVLNYMGAHLLYTLSISYLLVTLALFLINIKWKISVHCAGMAGVATDATYIFGLSAIPLFFLVPVIAWVRYKIHSHTIGQLIAGSIVSIVISLFVFSVFYPIL